MFVGKSFIYVSALMLSSIRSVFSVPVDIRNFEASVTPMTMTKTVSSGGAVARDFMPISTQGGFSLVEQVGATTTYLVLSVIDYSNANGGGLVTVTVPTGNPDLLSSILQYATGVIENQSAMEQAIASSKALASSASLASVSSESAASVASVSSQSVASVLSESALSVSLLQQSISMVAQSVIQAKASDLSVSANDVLS
ncbi:hypothetical protein AYI68_g3391, partial [Smittium mucronatum]